MPSPASHQNWGRLGTQQQSPMIHPELRREPVGLTPRRQGTKSITESTAASVEQNQSLFPILAWRLGVRASSEIRSTRLRRIPERHSTAAVTASLRDGKELKQDLQSTRTKRKLFSHAASGYLHARLTA